MSTLYTCWDTIIPVELKVYMFFFFFWGGGGGEGLLNSATKRTRIDSEEALSCALEAQGELMATAGGNWSGFGLWALGFRV